MKKAFVLLLAVMACGALPLFAQEQDMPKEAMPSMAMPTPLADDLCAWMVGEWEGWSTSPMGKSQDWQKVEMGLDNQFVITHYTAKTSEANPEAMKAWAESMKMSKEDMDKMMSMTYKGMGPMTINPMTGEFVGYWFDNMRGMYKGTGKREGNKFTIKWEGGPAPIERTYENERLGLR